MSGSMTYRKLKEELEKLNEEQLDSDLTVMLIDGPNIDVYPMQIFVSKWPDNLEDGWDLYLDEVNGVLDDNHPFFIAHLRYTEQGEL